MEEPRAAQLEPDQCDACGITDTAPKHTVGFLNMPGVAVVRHFDCCSAAGCPDEGNSGARSCTRTLQLSGYLKDDALRNWIITGGKASA